MQPKKECPESYRITGTLSRLLRLSECSQLPRLRHWRRPLCNTSLTLRGSCGKFHVHTESVHRCGNGAGMELDACAQFLNPRSWMWPWHADFAGADRGRFPDVCLIAQTPNSRPNTVREHTGVEINLDLRLGEKGCRGIDNASSKGSDDRLRPDGRYR
jgi:hypothetical protein